MGEGKTYNFGETLWDLIKASIVRETVGYSTGGVLNLGGSDGEDGGAGGPPRGVIGSLPQTKVTFDLTEAETPENYGTTRSGWTNSLLDNLNHIRYKMQPTTYFEPIFDDTYAIEIGDGLWWNTPSGYIVFEGDTVVIDLPDSDPRIDVIYINNNGSAAISKGTPTASPIATYPLGVHLPVCEIYMYPSGMATSGVGYYYQSGTHQGFLYEDVRPYLQEAAGADYLDELFDVSVPTPTDAQILRYVTANSQWEADSIDNFILPGGRGGNPVLQIDGPITPTQHVGGAYICTYSGLINAVYIYCEDLGISGSTIIDVNINFVSIFDDPNDRPTLEWDDANSVQKVTISGTFNEEDILSVDIDQVALGSSGLTVTVSMDDGTGGAHPHTGGPHTGVLGLTELEDGGTLGHPLLAGGPGSDPNYDQVDTVGIAPQAVGGTEIKHLAVVNSKIADYAVTAVKVGDGVPVLENRQGSSATDWSAPGATDYAVAASKFQAGAVSSYVAGASGGTPGQAVINVTFPEAFTYPPVLTFGIKTSNAASEYFFKLTSVTAAGFVGTLYVTKIIPATLTIYWQAVGLR